MLHTTFAKLYDASACENAYRHLARKLSGIKKYGRDRPIPLTFGLDNDFDFYNETLWCLRACVEHDEAQRIGRLLAADYAERVLYLFEKEHPNDKRPREAIEVARRFAVGKATQDELVAARAAAWAAAGAATGAAAGAAARDAAGAAEKEWQIARFRGYLEGEPDKYVTLNAVVEESAP